MKKLELKYLAPYGDKNCEYLTRENTKLPFDFEDLYDIQQHIADYPLTKWEDTYKLILRPLSDLTKKEKLELAKKHNRLFGFDPDQQGRDMSLEMVRLAMDGQVWNYPKWIIDFLFERHFDVFGLIPAGLAIDKNTLK